VGSDLGSHNWVSKKRILPDMEVHNKPSKGKESSMAGQVFTPFLSARFDKRKCPLRRATRAMDL